jgi:eukaryotic-like serine/threonine-protein kinase
VYRGNPETSPKNARLHTCSASCVSGHKSTADRDDWEHLSEQDEGELVEDHELIIDDAREGSMVHARQRPVGSLQAERAVAGNPDAMTFERSGAGHTATSHRNHPVRESLATDEGVQYLGRGGAHPTEWNRQKQRVYCDPGTGYRRSPRNAPQGSIPNEYGDAEPGYRIPSRPSARDAALNSSELDASPRALRREGPNIARNAIAGNRLIREGDILLGKYRVERVTKEGFAVVAEAFHLELGSRVYALIVSPIDNASERARNHVLRCARVLTRFHSEHIARIQDAGTLDSDAAFIISQLTGMTDLHELTRDHGALSISSAVDYAIQIAEALAEGHSYGAVCGALSPNNVRVSIGMDGTPVATIACFGGLAHWALGAFQSNAIGMRRSPSLASAVPYMSPQQIRHPDELDLRADIWALGAVLHELLAGEPPFTGDTNAALLASIVADTPTPITAIRNDVPRELETVLLRCLNKEPADRYPSMAELARALVPFASAESLGIVDRIARVVARVDEERSPERRTSKALVHVRRLASGNASSASTESAIPPTPMPAVQNTPPPTWRAMEWIPKVVVVGMLAGCGGAALTSYTLRVFGGAPSRGAESIAAQIPLKDAEVFAATPISSSRAAQLGNSQLTAAHDEQSAGHGRLSSSTVTRSLFLPRPAKRVAPAATTASVASAGESLPPGLKSATSSGPAPRSADRTEQLFGDIK